MECEVRLRFCSVPGHLLSSHTELLFTPLYKVRSIIKQGVASSVFEQKPCNVAKLGRYLLDSANNSFNMIFWYPIWVWSYTIEIQVSSNLWFVLHINPILYTHVYLQSILKSRKHLDQDNFLLKGDIFWSLVSSRYIYISFNK